MENIENMKPMSKNFKQTISKKMILIDLNQNIINFECNLIVKSNNKPFQAVVVTQEQLDSQDFIIEYQNVVNGIIDANIENKSNIYNNYCLLLKSENECEVDINISIQPLPEIIQKKSLENYNDLDQQSTLSTQPHIPFYKTNTFMWIIIFIGIILIIYLLFSDNKKIDKNSVEVELSSANIHIKSPSPSHVSSPPSNDHQNINVSDVKINSNFIKSPSSLLSKLKNTNI